jgi:hypothetical protein
MEVINWLLSKAINNKIIFANEAQSRVLVGKQMNVLINHLS